MTTRVGIPRALLYYQYYPMWQAFFEEFGVETAISPPTTKDIVTSGCSRTVAETCLPVKIFCGHVLSLVDKCDYMFIPVIRSMGKNAYNCSKLLGLPDITKAVIPESPPILDVEIDANKSKYSLYRAIYSLGRHFTKNPLRIEKATKKAWKIYLAYRQKMSSEGLMPTQIIDKMCDKRHQVNLAENDSPPLLNIAVIGHPYLIYDDYINHRLITQVQAMGAKVLTPEMVSEQALDAAMTSLVGSPRWTYEADVVGAGGYYLQTKVDGIIGLAAFACGPDSMMMNIIQRRARQLKAPFLYLTLDEHTAEGGMLTRLEAFLDMVKRRKRGQSCA